MPLNAKTTNIPTNTGVIKANNVNLTKVIANGVVVWEKVVFTSKDFVYKGYVEEWEVPVDGNYQLEVYGAEGGTWRRDHDRYVKSVGGKGGYAVGTKYLTAGQKLYICVGCSGNTLPVANKSWYDDGSYIPEGFYAPGGYNGGADGHSAGGGATHIALGNNRGILKNYELYKSEILIVAGGGGGGGWGFDYKRIDTDSVGGTGGGTNGGNGSTFGDGLGTYYDAGNGGTQSQGGTSGDTISEYSQGKFGQGGMSSARQRDPYSENPLFSAGGGGGWYGGGAGDNYTDGDEDEEDYGSTGAGGGSGYTGGVNSGSMSNGLRSGNGYAKITLL